MSSSAIRPAPPFQVDRRRANGGEDKRSAVSRTAPEPDRSYERFDDRPKTHGEQAEPIQSSGRRARRIAIRSGDDDRLHPSHGHEGAEGRPAGECRSRSSPVARTTPRAHAAGRHGLQQESRITTSGSRATGGEPLPTTPCQRSVTDGNAGVWCQHEPATTPAGPVHQQAQLWGAGCCAVSGADTPALDGRQG